VSFDWQGRAFPPLRAMWADEVSFDRPRRAFPPPRRGQTE